jgi:hypothetical protein
MFVNGGRKKLQVTPTNLVTRRTRHCHHRQQWPGGDGLTIDKSRYGNGDGMDLCKDELEFWNKD